MECGWAVCFPAARTRCSPSWTGCPRAVETNPIAQFRKASALRALGQYRQARTAIERALELLPPGNLAVHADLVREHTLITAAHDLTQLARRR
ncbi:tetratricopeptide repeat protein [Streptomyces sp. NPDC060006]|uniref:tetratricopeptide repeat protein n=1 Tax=unclassified Streptomyces TaxID=2593676 RepID=UPI00369594EC